MGYLSSHEWTAVEHLLIQAARYKTKKQKQKLKEKKKTRLHASLLHMEAFVLNWLKASNTRSTDCIHG
jgi:hypothetical protein